MTTVRIAHAEPHFDPGPDGTTAARRILVVLADDPGRHRAMGLWLPARQAMGAVADPGPAVPRQPAVPARAPCRRPGTCRSGSSPPQIWPAGCSGRQARP